MHYAESVERTVHRWLAAAVVLAANVGLADPAAEQLFRDGKQRLKDGKRDEACELFQRSQDLEPKVGTLLNLADCREQQGRIATAWDDFVQARALASQKNDTRVVEAGKRANALELRLPYMTVEAPAPIVPGLVVTRNGGVVAPAALNTAVPLDPGIYTIEARAPGFVTWSKRVELAESGRVTIAIPALVADPTLTVTPDNPPAPDKPPVVEVWPPLRRGSLGVAFGTNSEGEVVVGLRGSVGWPVPRGAIRLIFTALFERFSNDPGDAQNNTNLYALGSSVDYLFAWRRNVGSAAGLGFGLDILTPAYDRIATGAWISPRISPVIVRFANLELGLHLHLALPRVVLIGVVGLDWFIW